MEMLTTITKSAISTPVARGEKSEVTSDFSGVAELQDGDLLSSAKTAIDLYKGAGHYVYVHLKELRARYERGKKIKKPYLGYTNFDSLCDEKLELTSRQVRNILNGDPTGKKRSRLEGKAPKRLASAPKTERDKHFFNAGIEAQERIQATKPEKTLYLHSSAEELKHAAKIARNAAEAEMQLKHAEEMDKLRGELAKRIAAGSKPGQVKTVNQLGASVSQTPLNGKLLGKNPAPYTAAELVKTAIGFIDSLVRGASKEDTNIFLRSLAQELDDRMS